jgi:putative DNA primase/helicase
MESSNHFLVYAEWIRIPPWGADDTDGWCPETDRRDAEKFLTALDPAASTFTFQTFDDDEDRKDGALIRVFHGSLDRHWRTLCRLNERGAGIFVTVNETDGKARKAKNITRVRAPHVDLDGAPLPTKFHAEPHIIIESSPGRWHVYWLVADLPLDEFTPLQKRLIALYGSDTSVHDLPRVMRLPGFIHRKAEPFLSRLIEVNGHAAYAVEQFTAKLPKSSKLNGGKPMDVEQRLADMRPGENVNDTLLRVGASLLSRCVPRGQVVDQLVARALELDPNWNEKEQRAEIESMCDRWLKKHPEIARTDNAPPFSEEAIALDLASRQAEALRFVSEWGKWFCWDGTCWREDKTRKVFSISRALCRETAATVNKPSESKKIASAKTRAAVVSLASEDLRLVATVDQWDTDPWLLNTPGGVVDLRTGKLREHRAEDYMTQQAAVAPGGDCPMWKKFMYEITGGDSLLQDYLQRVAGYSLTGTTHEQELFFLYGPGNNGKTVFIKILSGVLGDYHRGSSIETFTVSQVERHPTELAGLRGARLVTAAETEEGRRWAEARIKELTGGDKISARFMRQDFFEFYPQFKLLFSGNHMPTLRAVNKAITRRFNRILFGVIIPDERVNPHLADELLAQEGPGILAWFIEGCLAWQREGLNPPAAVTAATDEYLESQDVLGEWLEECCDVGGSYFATRDELFDSWKQWAQDRNEWVGSMKTFLPKLDDRGFKRDRFKGERGFRGLQLKPSQSLPTLPPRG